MTAAAEVDIDNSIKRKRICVWLKNNFVFIFGSDEWKRSGAGLKTDKEFLIKFEILEL